MQVGKKSDPTILVLCVNYKSDADTQSFVHSIANCPARAEYILVISNSPEEEVGGLSSLSGIEGVSVLFTERNLGYFGAATYGLSEFLKTHPLPEWIIVSNADITFHDHELFRKLKTQYPPNAAPAVVAPDIVAGYSGHLSVSPTHQNPYMRDRPGAIKMLGFYLITKSYAAFAAYGLFTKIKNTMINRLLRRKQDGSHTSELASIYAPFGAFIIFNRSYFEEGGSLDHGAFLYGEETFVAETVRRLNMNIAYNPRLAVTHSHRQTVTLLPSRIEARYTKEATAYLVNSFFRNK